MAESSKKKRTRELQRPVLSIMIKAYAAELRVQHLEPDVQSPSAEMLCSNNSISPGSYP